MTTTEQDRRQLCEPSRTVDTIRLMTDRDTGRSWGFGFLEMPDSPAAQDALAGLHGTPLAGRTRTVNAARLRAPRRAPRPPRGETAPRRPQRARLTACRSRGRQR